MSYTTCCIHAAIYFDTVLRHSKGSIIYTRSSCRSVLNSRIMISVAKRRNILHWWIDLLRLKYEEAADSAHKVRVAYRNELINF
jgi:hypothetical protein